MTYHGLWLLPWQRFRLQCGSPQGVGRCLAGVAQRALWDGSLEGKSSLVDLCRTWFLVAWRRPELEALLGWDWGLSWLMCFPQ